MSSIRDRGPNCVDDSDAEIDYSAGESGMKRPTHTSKRQVDPQKSSLTEITQRNVELIAAMESAANQSRSRAELFADWATAIVGSWTFLIVQSVLLIIWMA